MSDRLTPEQTAEYLEVSQDQFLELVRPSSGAKQSTSEESRD